MSRIEKERDKRVNEKKIYIYKKTGTKRKWERKDEREKMIKRKKSLSFVSIHRHKNQKNIIFYRLAGTFAPYIGAD